MEISKLEVFNDFTNSIENIENRDRFIQVIEFVNKEFPELETAIKWSQPMFLDHGTFIIAFSVTKNHINVAPEKEAIIHFEEVIKDRGLKATKMYVQLKWNKTVDYDIIKKFIEYNIIQKQNTKTFWR